MKQLNWYQIFGKSNIPDGRTVEPTDDIQIWLHCANIWDKAYTTLYEVLNDTATLSALMASDNAVDYLVRSTSWAVPITVPVMTSNTTPSGVASSNNEGQPAYYAFDNNSGTYWSAHTADDVYLQYQFNESIVLAKWAYQGTSSYLPSKIKLQGSNDGISFTEIDSVVTPSSDTDVHERNVSTTTAYLYYRMICSARYTSAYGYYSQLTSAQFYSASVTTSADAMSLIGQNNYCANTLLADATWCEAIGKSEYVESVCNVKVPKMTSNTTPSGVCSASTVSGSNYAYMAFDEVAGNAWMATSGTNQSVTYKFTESKLIKLVTLQVLIDSAAARVKNFKVQGSNDGVTYTDIKSCVYENNHNLQAFELSENETSYQYLRVYVTDNYNTSLYISITALQFYGREDV